MEMHLGEDMIENNTKQINGIMVRIFRACSGFILFLFVCSKLNIFEFGEKYTILILTAGMVITISPSILIRFFSDDFLKYYMLFLTAVFIGILGTNNHIGIYITYVLVTVFSCLYFEPALVVRSSLFSYLVMLLSLYVNTASKYEVIYEKRDHLTIFIAYALGFTIEFLLVDSVLYFLVKRAKMMMQERHSAQEESRLKSKLLAEISHEVRTPMNAVIGMSEVALRREEDKQLQDCFKVIISSSKGVLEAVNDTLGSAEDIETAKENGISDDMELLYTKNVHILVVDDNGLNRRILKELFEPMLLEIDEAENGKQALEMCQNTTYDLIFMDCRMPVMNGEEATRAIRMTHKKKNENTPIIAVTADAVNGVRERMILCGMNDYIEKPVDIERIYQIFIRYLPKEKIFYRNHKGGVSG